MNFFLDIEPPTATAQMKKVRVVRGRLMFYEPKKVKGGESAPHDIAQDACPF